MPVYHARTRGLVGHVLAMLFAVIAVNLSAFINISTAMAQSTSGQTVRVIVPYAPGGSTDVLARLIFTQLGSRLGTPIVIENRPGAHGLIGAKYAYDAKPDGQTLLLGAADNISVAPHIFKNIAKFDPDRYTPIASITKIGFVLSGRAENPIRTLEDLISRAKNVSAADKPYSYGHWGIGSMAHMGMEMLKSESGITQGLIDIPFQGGGPVLTALLGGHVDYALLPTPLAVAQQTKLTLYGFSSTERFSGLKDVPTLKEQGVNVEAETWYGLLAPPGTPDAAVADIRTGLLALLKEPEVRHKMAEMGFAPLEMSQEEFAKYFRGQNARWGRIVKASGIKAQD